MGRVTHWVHDLYQLVALSFSFNFAVGFYAPQTPLNGSKLHLNEKIAENSLFSIKLAFGRILAIFCRFFGHDFPFLLFRLSFYTLVLKIPKIVCQN